MLSLLRLERKQKNYSNPFRIRIFLFLSYSFGIETINTFIHSRSSLKNHTRFQTKSVYPFSDQNSAKILSDRATPAYIREYPPGFKRSPIFPCQHPWLLIRTLRGHLSITRRYAEHAVACVAWRFCRAGRTSGEAAKFAREVHENEQQSREKNKTPPRGFSALARLCHLARPTKTAMLRRLGMQWWSPRSKLGSIYFHTSMIPGQQTTVLLSVK